MLILGFKQCRFNAGIYYFIDKKTREFVIAIVYVNDVCFICSKDFLLLLEMKQIFMTKWKCCNLGETKEFLGMYINYNCRNQNIFIDQSEYLNKVLVHTIQYNNQPNKYSTFTGLYIPNNKQCDSNFYQKY